MSCKWILLAAVFGFSLFILGFIFQVQFLHSMEVMVPITHSLHTFKSTFKSTPIAISSATSVSQQNSQNIHAISESSLIGSYFRESKSPVSMTQNELNEATVNKVDKSEDHESESQSPATWNSEGARRVIRAHIYLDQQSLLNAGRPTSLALPSKSDFRLDALNSKKSLDVLSNYSKQLSVVDSEKNLYISTYLQKGLHIPIVLLTCNRPELLKQTILSLLRVRGISRDCVAVSQDGALQEIKDLIAINGFRHFQNLDGQRLRGGAGVADESAPIAKHYKFSLDHAFEAFPTAPAIIIVEDDLLFSPDFLEYFESVGPVLDVDPTVMAVSAWNDNGFKGKVKDSLALMRTDFFPGLGWMLSRTLYLQELQRQWPSAHWDHWLRSQEIHQGREIVHPEVPRTYHNGIKGTFMNIETHNRYFKDIDYLTDPNVQWPKTAPVSVSTGIASASQVLQLPLYAQVVENAYEARIETMISKCTHVRNVQEILSNTPGLYCIWFDLNPQANWGIPQEFEPIAKFFGIWHEHQRGCHHGLHEFRWQEDSYILLLNTHNSLTQTYKYLKPTTATTMQANQFDPKLLLDSRRRQMGLIGTKADRPGMSCDQVCASHKMICREDLLKILNTCAALNEAFPCHSCGSSYGPDQPAMVDNSGGRPQAGQCLYNVNADTTSCGGSHRDTIRLCACA